VSTRARSVEEHLDYRAAAARLSMSVSTVKRLVADGVATNGRRGIYPVRRPSRQLVLIPASAINRYLEAITG